MRVTRTVTLAVIIVAWIVALGSLINSFTDVAAFPEVVRSILGLWPDPDSSTGTVVRFGAVAVLIASILGYRFLGKAIQRSEQDPDQAARMVGSGK
ncbi:hypothetical protein C3E77_09300 [Mycetocola zhujimingii]|nr:hypothetical protein C3E77_09300 [Mycetocola zhujimingii]